MSFLWVRQDPLFSCKLPTEMFLPNGDKQNISRCEDEVNINIKDMVTMATISKQPPLHQHPLRNSGHSAQGNTEKGARGASVQCSRRNHAKSWKISTLVRSFTSLPRPRACSRQNYERKYCIWIPFVCMYTIVLCQVLEDVSPPVSFGSFLSFLSVVKILSLIPSWIRHTHF